MDKKPIFRRVIADFIEKPLMETFPRKIDLPHDVPKVVSLLGPRRAGKTYVLFHLIAEFRQNIPPNRLVYLNFEDDRLFPLRLEDMDALVQAYYEMYPENREERVWFFFDEVQEVPKWEKFIRRLLDTENCRIYLTGSSSKLLSRELATSLRGRTLPFEVFPLNFNEFLDFNRISINPETSKGLATVLHWFDRWLDQGGFPELVFLPEHLHRKTVEEYLNLMLYRDLTERFSIKNPSLLKYLLKYIVGNLAQPISLSKAFNDLKSQGYAISKNTVHDYVSYLEEAFIIFKVDIWHRSVRAQAVNPSKMYLIDPALKYVMSIGKDRGRVLENVIFLHLRRKGIAPHYLLDKQEVDFFWENGEPVNACLEFDTPATREREIKGMTAFLRMLDLPAGRILTRDHSEEIKTEEKTIIVQPAWSYFLTD
jgi:predicted AAA+ superfamily ATPase